MNYTKIIFAVGAICAAAALPTFAQEATPSFNPKGNFVDSFGTSFSFTLCGDTKTDLCGVLTNLEGQSATKTNLTFVGKQVMQAKQSAANQWKGALSAGGISADATVTQVGPDTINIQGCRAVILCQTLAYNRS